MKGITSHVTVNGKPVCQQPLPYLDCFGWAYILRQCEYRSLYAARKAAKACRSYRVKAVKGSCPQGGDV